MAQVRSPFELPGYLDALHHERIQRPLAFHNLRERILGFEVGIMTLRQYSLLRLVNSPFLPPFETPSQQQLIQVLWILSPHFTTQETAAKREFFQRAKKLFIPPPTPRFKNRLFTLRWYFKRKACEINEATALAALRKSMEDIFADRPESAGSDGPEYYSDECAIVGTLAEEYGWSRETILDLKLPEIFQHLKRIREMLYAKNGQVAPISNSSDDVIQRHLEEVNRKN